VLACVARSREAIAASRKIFQRVVSALSAMLDVVRIKLIVASRHPAFGAKEIIPGETYSLADEPVFSKQELQARDRPVASLVQKTCLGSACHVYFVPFATDFGLPASLNSAQRQ
jgi:hypothetical protein